MSTLAQYADKYANAKITRSAVGILEVTFHTDGKKLVFNGHTHEEFADLFHQIGEDADNRVLILTGSGDAFIDSIASDGFDFFTPRGYDKIFREGRKLLMNILDIDVPMIAALNGPVLVHSEFALLCDIVIATPETIFQDMPHAAFGIAPNDGIHLLWPEIIGSIRGRYFILTQQKIAADEAKSLGVVNEIVPANRLMQRARELAAGIARMPPLTSKYTRIGFTQRLRRIVDEGIGYGLALEGISAAEVGRAAALDPAVKQV
jgi:enoyl-CoA hydratase/carnithine racemase